VQPNRVVRQHSVADGINAVRMVLPRAWFDAERCAKGIHALRHYRREWNEAAQAWRASPVHDHASHGADSARYLCLGVREDQPAPVERVVREPWEYQQPGAANAEWMRM
jgi:phage terminase large subunit